MAEKKPSLGERLAQRYRTIENYHRSTGISLSFPAFMGLILIVASAVAFILLRVLSLGPLIAGISFVAIATLVLGIPVSMRNNRIAAVETNLPDVLKHMAAVLRAGGTTESALEEVAKSDYGPLSEDLNLALRQLREGRTFDEVLTDTAAASGSTLFVRIATIVIDAKRAGAGLADIMSSIAEDARDLLRIKRERVTRTTMHVLFLYAASVLLGPFIFGFTLSIVSYIGLGTAGALGDISAEQAGALKSTSLNMETLNGLVTMFIGVQVILTQFVIGVIREGKMLKYIIRMPFMVLFALLAFEAGKYFSKMIIGG